MLVEIAAIVLSSLVITSGTTSSEAGEAHEASASFGPRLVMAAGEWDKTLLSKPYPGQSDSGDGTIFDSAAYVKARYGSGYSLVKEKHLWGYEYTAQYDYSIYYKLKKNKKNQTLKYSEGNCTLTSIYSMLNYLRSTRRFPRLPSSSNTIRFDAKKKDRFYKTYAKKSNYKIDTPKKLPTLYADVRNYAVKESGYKTGGTNPFKIDNIIKSVLKKYKHKPNKVSHIKAWTYARQVVNEIDDGYPTIFNSLGSTTYVAHSMVVTGYVQYRKKVTNSLGLWHYKYVNLARVNDNWTAAPRYFDFTSFKGLASFVRVR
jgi:hypothetical protein